MACSFFTCDSQFNLPSRTPSINLTLQFCSESLISVITLKTNFILDDSTFQYGVLMFCKLLKTNSIYFIPFELFLKMICIQWVLFKIVLTAEWLSNNLKEKMLSLDANKIYFPFTKSSQKCLYRLPR